MFHGAVFTKKGVAPPTYSRSARRRSFGGFISKVCRKNKVSQVISKKSPLVAIKISIIRQSASRGR
jgi:hypothetical protein